MARGYSGATSLNRCTSEHEGALSGTDRASVGSIPGCDPARNRMTAELAFSWCSSTQLVEAVPRVDGRRAAAETLAIEWHYTDLDLTVRTALSIQTENPVTPSQVDLSLTLTRAELPAVLSSSDLAALEQARGSASLTHVDPTASARGPG